MDFSYFSDDSAIRLLYDDENEESKFNFSDSKKKNRKKRKNVKVTKKASIPEPPIDVDAIKDDYPYRSGTKSIDFHRVRVNSVSYSFTPKSPQINRGTIESPVVFESKLSSVLLQKQLGSAIKKLDVYSKENKELTKRLDSSYIESENDKLRQQLLDQRNTIQALTEEKRALANMNRNQEKLLVELQKSKDNGPETAIANEHHIQVILERMKKLQKELLLIRQRERVTTSKNEELKMENSRLKEQLRLKIESLNNYSAIDHTNNNTTNNNNNLLSDESNQSTTDINNQNEIFDKSIEDSNTLLHQRVSNHSAPPIISTGTTGGGVGNKIQLKSKFLKAKCKRLERLVAALQKGIETQKSVFKHDLLEVNQEMLKYKEELERLNKELELREKESRAHVSIRFLIIYLFLSLLECNFLYHFDILL